jgi:nucleotide-binding universal stress UspA family protein
VNQLNYKMALDDFRTARQRAALEEVFALVTGRSNDLLSYEEVARRLKLIARSEGGTHTIPVKAIIGSVGRYTEFTRTFLPRKANDQERWARVKSVFMDPIERGLPPIEVYHVSDVYFVLDGNHRVSIARQEGVEFIDAHVIEVKTTVPITPDIQPDDLIIKAEYADFIEETGINNLRPNVDLNVTIPGQYEKLKEQIQLQELLLQETSPGKVSFSDAVIEWYDKIYMPLADAIQDRGLMRWFSTRTITDMYLWISEHREALQEELGWSISPDAAVSDLAVRESSKADSYDKKLGSWREARIMDRYTESLFNDILVPIGVELESWQALDQAIIIGQKDGARLHGLHVVKSKKMLNGSVALEIQRKFKHKCETANLDGNLVIEVGEITRKISERAILTDLIVVKVSHPPQTGLAVLNSSFRSIISRSSRPLLAVPGKSSNMDRALLAYDGSPKSKEALFVATYLAEQWKIHLTVLTAQDGSRSSPEIQDYVHTYLELHEIDADFMVIKGSANEIKDIVRDCQINLVLMGGYSGSAVIEMVIGSTLDFMLRELSTPIFICR